MQNQTIRVLNQGGEQLRDKAVNWKVFRSNQNKKFMILSTTPSINGRNIREYKGVVFGETIIGANIFKDILSGIRDIVGGRAGQYEQVLQEARETAMREMTERAQAMGANAVVGIDVDYEVIGGSGSMLMVSTSGTAVLLD